MASEKFETLGIVEWYNLKGYGIIKNIHDNTDYFIHCSNLVQRYKGVLNEGDIILFTPSYDTIRNRAIAINVRYVINSTDIKWAIKTWTEEDFVSDNILEKIFINYFGHFSKNEFPNVNDAFEPLLDVILSFFDEDVDIKNLYLILKEAVLSFFKQEESNSNLEIIELTMFEKNPITFSEILLDETTSSYVCLYIAYKSENYEKKAVKRAIELSFNTYQLLDDLIRIVKDINNQNIKDLLEENINLITNEDFYKSIVGNSIISSINRFIFTLDYETLKNLIDKGYIHDIDNSILRETNPENYKKVMILAYKEGKVDTVNISFIEDNINQFSASSLIKIKQVYHISDNDSSELFLCRIRFLLINHDDGLFNEVILISQEIQDIHSWLSDNRNYLKKNNENEYQELLVFLYKKNQVVNVDENFIVYYIDKFSIKEIIDIIGGDNGHQITTPQKEKILSALFKKTIENPSYDRIENLETICNHAKEFLEDQYSLWFDNIYTSTNDENRFLLWKYKFTESFPNSYIRETLLTSKEEGYRDFYNYYQQQLMSKYTACKELIDTLSENQEVKNRPIFYKILYCIKYLLMIDNSRIEEIEKKGNDYYNLFLWFLSYTSTFDYSLLCRLFIYFMPKDQVLIIKRVFYMAEDNQIELNVEMLEKLLRIDADLYNLITEHHPEIPIDISSEIVIKALKNLSENGAFSTDKDVLTIIIHSGKYIKNERFKIGEYFDDCSGRLLYIWDGNRTITGKISKTNEEFFCVLVNTHINGWISGHYYDNVWNDSFHDMVDDIKNIVGRRWNKEKQYWEVPIQEEERLLEIAEEYGMSIDGTNNAHLRKYKEKNDGKPARVLYCEGRPAQKQDEYVRKPFLWCRNSKCYSACVKEHSKEEWQKYTLLDFCRILGLNTDSTDSKGRFVKYGKYLSFTSIINRANSILEHLYCKECNEMLEPVQISDYYTHLVTHFHCTNESCKMFHHGIYISKCFNWKCNGVIDDRDTKKCPNGWNICSVCGSCCSNRIAEQRITHCTEIGIEPSRYFYEFLAHKLGHLEKKEFYCCKCGGLMNNIGDNIYQCPICGVKYDRKKYDFEPRYSTTTPSH